MSPWGTAAPPLPGHREARHRTQLPEGAATLREPRAAASESRGKLRAAPSPRSRPPRRARPPRPAHTHPASPRPASPLGLGPAASCQVGPGAGRGGGGAEAAGAGRRRALPCAAGPGSRGVGAADPAAIATLPALPAERCPCGRADGCGDRALLRGASPAAEPGGALLAGGNCCALEGRLFPQGRRYSGGEKKRVLLRGAVRLCKVETTTSMPPNAHARPRAVPSRGRSYPAAPHWLSRSSGLV